MESMETAGRLVSAREPCCAERLRGLTEAGGEAGMIQGT